MTYAFTDNAQVEELPQVDATQDWAAIQSQDLSLTLTRSQWETIRLCCLFSSSDAQNGYCDKSPEWSRLARDAYHAMRDAMGLDSIA